MPLIIGWKTVGSALVKFLAVIWPILLVIGITLGVAHQYYYSPKLDTLNLELKICQNEVDDARQIIKEQSEAVTNLSETSVEVTRQFLKDLNTVLSTMSDENRRTIQSILDAGVPEGCEDSRQYLIDMVDRLQWDGVE